jgi:TolB-like protein
LLPFANISSDREQEYFADGMVKEIITAAAMAAFPTQPPQEPALQQLGI